MFDWDDANEGHIWERHRVTRDEAEEALDDPGLITASAGGFRGERRFWALGRSAGGRVLLVVFVKRSAAVRVVTARDAEPDEKRRYRRGRK